MSEPKRLSVPTNPALALRQLNREQAADATEESDTKNYNTILQRDKPTNNNSDTQTDQLTNKQSIQNTDIPTDIETDSTTNKQAKKQGSKPANIRTTAPSRKPPLQQVASVQEPEPRKARIDGRTMRPRQETADQTMVTSLRLAVATVDQLDEYCWRNRQRKQDVVQAALTLYFETMATDEN